MEERSYINNLVSLDWELAVKLADSNYKLAENLMDIMLNSLEAELKLINLAYSKKDLINLREYVHKLYGGCCYTGLVKLKFICKQLEQLLMLKEGYVNQDYIDQVKVKTYWELLNQEVKLLLGNYNFIKK